MNKINGQLVYTLVNHITIRLREKVQIIGGSLFLKFPAELSKCSTTSKKGLKFPVLFHSK